MTKYIVYMRVGDGPKRIEVGFSEAAMHLGVAGKELRVAVAEDGMAYLYDDSGSQDPITMGVTPGEAGLYRNSDRIEDGYHGYRQERNGETQER